MVCTTSFNIKYLNLNIETFWVSRDSENKEWPGFWKRIKLLEDPCFLFGIQLERILVSEV
jgi:hypothetical protein